MMKITIASYALVDVLRALENNGVHNCAITKEDGQLELNLSQDDLRPHKQYCIPSSKDNLEILNEGG